MFNVSDNDASIYVVEKTIDTSSCVIVSFTYTFALSTALIMDSVRKRLVLVGGSDTTSDTTYLWLSEVLPGVLQKIFLPKILMHFSVYLDTLEESLFIVLLFDK